MIFNTWKDKRGCLSASDGTSLQSFIPEIGICPSWVRCWSMWLLPRRRSPLPIPHPEIEEMVSVKPYIQLLSFINAKISDVGKVKLLQTKVSISLSTPICCSIILYVVWQATAGMLLSVEPFLLNNKPQLWVVTTEPDQFFTTIFTFSSSLKWKLSWGIGINGKIDWKKEGWVNTSLKLRKRFSLTRSSRLRSINKNPKSTKEWRV